MGSNEGYVDHKWLFGVLGSYLIGIILIGGPAVWFMVRQIGSNQIDVFAAQNAAYLEHIQSLERSIEADKSEVSEKIKSERERLLSETNTNRILIEFAIREMGNNKNELKEIKSLLIGKGK